MFWLEVTALLTSWESFPFKLSTITHLFVRTVHFLHLWNKKRNYTVYVMCLIAKIVSGLSTFLVLLPGMTVGQQKNTSFSQAGPIWQNNSMCYNTILIFKIKNNLKGNKIVSTYLVDINNWTLLLPTISSCGWKSSWNPLY